LPFRELLGLVVGLLAVMTYVIVSFYGITSAVMFTTTTQMALLRDLALVNVNRACVVNLVLR